MQGKIIIERYPIHFLKNAEHFKYVGTTVTILIPEEIKKRMISGNACYHSYIEFKHRI
jgi:hypothetical protein